MAPNGHAQLALAEKEPLLVERVGRTSEPRWWSSAALGFQPALTEPFQVIALGTARDAECMVSRPGWETMHQGHLAVPGGPWGHDSFSAPFPAFHTSTEQRSLTSLCSCSGTFPACIRGRPGLDNSATKQSSLRAGTGRLTTARWTTRAAPAARQPPCWSGARRPARHQRHVTRPG